MASDTLSPPLTSLSEEPSNYADNSEPTTVKKSRRQTAFYPNMNASNKPPKPFSRSAAKRESVMALGSIEHLQHYFTKTGIAAKKNPLKPSSGVVPAIGPAHIRSNPSLGSIQEFELPPSPTIIPAIIKPPFPHIEKNYETDPENLRPGVIQDLDAVSRAWRFSGERDTDHLDTEHLSAEKGKGKMPSDFDVLSTLKLTTRAIRSVRNYLVSLPDESGAAPPHPEKLQFRASSFSPAKPKRVVSSPNSPSDPLTLIRRSALEVLTVLRALEEESRLPLSDDAYDAQSEHDSSLGASTHSRAASPNTVEEHADASFAFSVVSVPGRQGSIHVWPEEDDDFDFDEADAEKREAWDQRLVLGGGWLYKQDIRLEDLPKEQEAVRKYLDSVDNILFGGPSDGQRGWERAAAKKEKSDKEGRGKGRRVSAGDFNGRVSPASSGDTRRIVSAGMLDTMQNLMVTDEPEGIAEEEEDSVDDEELPDWAKRASFAGDPLGRAHALLTHLLPIYLVFLLPSPMPNRITLLEALASGQLLCIAYNTGVRRSRKAWGYINEDAVHDIAALEAKVEPSDTGDAAEKRLKGWTFRRTDNLRLWAAALKLRYLIPLVGPKEDGGTPQSPLPLNSPSPSRVSFPTSETPIYFDAKAVARKDEGWDVMLEAVILRWMGAVVEEKRCDS